MAVIGPSIKKTDSKKWKYVVEKDWVVYIDQLKNIKSYSFCTKKGDDCIEWMNLNQGIVTIRKGYATDGCTSSPDLNHVLPACLIHDVLYQAIRIDPDCPFCKRHADKSFYDMMRVYDAGKIALWLYYLAVSSPIGRAYQKLSRYFNKETDTVCVEENISNIEGDD